MEDPKGCQPVHGMTFDPNETISGAQLQPDSNCMRRASKSVFINTTKLPDWTLQGNLKTWDIEKWRHFWWFKWLPTLLTKRSYWNVFYAAQWKGSHHGRGCFFLQWNTGASGWAETVWSLLAMWRALICEMMTGFFEQVNAVVHNACLTMDFF